MERKIKFNVRRSILTAYNEFRFHEEEEEKFQPFLLRPQTQLTRIRILGLKDVVCLTKQRNTILDYLSQDFAQLSQTCSFSFSSFSAVSSISARFNTCLQLCYSFVKHNFELNWIHKFDYVIQIAAAAAVSFEATHEGASSHFPSSDSNANRIILASPPVSIFRLRTLPKACS